MTADSIVEPLGILQVNCFYPPYHPLGGGTIYCHNLASALRRRHKVEVFTGKISDPPTTLPYRVKIDHFEGTKTSRVILNYNNFDFSVLNYLNPLVQEAFEKCLDDFSPDIVHFHSLQGLGALLLVSAKKRRIPVVVTLHDSWWLCARQFFLLPDRRTICSGASYFKCVRCIVGPLKLFMAGRVTIAISVALRFYLLRRTLRLADLIITPSGYIFSRYKQYGLTTNALISRNGVDAGLTPGKRRVPRRDICFGFIGGRSDEKGFGVILRAVETLKPPTWKLKIWGAPAIRGREGAKYHRNIKFMGEFDTTEKSRVFSQFDVLLFPSLLPENCPLGILESLSCDVPVIASRIGGIPELVRNGTDGFLFSPGNDRELKDCMHKLLVDPARVARMKSRIREPHTILDQATEIEALYRKMLRGSGKEGPPQTSLSLNFNIFLAKFLFWSYLAGLRVLALWGIVKWLFTGASVQKRPDALMDADLSPNHLAKLIMKNARGELDAVLIYCDNLDKQKHVLQIEISDTLSRAPLTKKTLILPPESLAGWREVPIGMPWDSNTLALIISGDSNKFGRVGYDLTTPHDQYYTSDGKNWNPQPVKTWAVLQVDGRRIAASDDMNASMSRGVTSVVTIQEGRRTTASALFVLLAAAYILAQITPRVLTTIVRFFRKISIPFKKREARDAKFQKSE